MELYESSELLKKKKQNETPLSKLDFSKLEVGTSCIVPIGAVKESTLRTKVSIAKKKLKFELVCVKHNADGIFEIGRLS